MKKVITTVGISLLENCVAETKAIETHYKALGDLGSAGGSYEGEEERVKRVKDAVIGWLEREFRLSREEHTCAEVKSLIKLQSELKDDLEVYLLCSDTILGRLAGEILWEKLKEAKPLKSITPRLPVIVKDLQVADRRRFIMGVRNLIREIYRIGEGYWGNVVINITGGFKSTIPYLSMLGQVNRCPVYYVFEDAETLIRIPSCPLSVDWEVFEKHEEFFFRLEREGLMEVRKGEVNPDIASLLEEVDNLVALNPLGEVLWGKYRERFEIFCVSESVAKQAEKNREIVDRTLLELKRRYRETPCHPDLHHSLTIQLPQGYQVFKHTQNGLQVRVLYQVVKREGKYGNVDEVIRVADIAIGNEVHNAGGASEYVERFKGLSECPPKCDLTYRIDRKTFEGGVMHV
uniref:CRISPR system ring nuclease SSO1393-like domain-containing protein n=1 Tax=Candidatus Caldatribacterium saccharofermentans TaxID=1454753 RepID=A0A7V4WM13_9BACT